jgi:hypothetical protein
LGLPEEVFVDMLAEKLMDFIADVLPLRLGGLGEGAPARSVEGHPDFFHLSDRWDGSGFYFGCTDQLI